MFIELPEIDEEMLSMLEHQKIIEFNNETGSYEYTIAIRFLLDTIINKDINNTLLGGC